jgi:hypothetical protein
MTRKPALNTSAAVERCTRKDLLSNRSQPNPHRSSLADMFNLGQRTAVAGALRLAGYDGSLVVAPITSDDECFPPGARGLQCTP